MYNEAGAAFMPVAISFWLDPKTLSPAQPCAVDLPGPPGREVRPHHRQHHARSGAGRVRAGAGPLVVRQPAHLLPVEAGIRQTGCAHGYLRREPRRLRPAQAHRRRSQTAAARRRRYQRGQAPTPSTPARATSTSTTTPPARSSRSPRPPTPKPIRTFCPMANASASRAPATCT